MEVNGSAHTQISLTVYIKTTGQENERETSGSVPKQLVSGIWKIEKAVDGSAR